VTIPTILTTDLDLKSATLFSLKRREMVGIQIDDFRLAQDKVYNELGNIIVVLKHIIILLIFSLPASYRFFLCRSTGIMPLLHSVDARFRAKFAAIAVGNIMEW
jgi:hypothetical protein